MFNLKQSIAEWRQQMLAAGIKTPVPLEELEFHLREEIEERMKSGLNEVKAFKAAVQNMGQGRALQTEFNKVPQEHSMLRTMGLIIGWLAAAFMLLVGVQYWEMCWNFLWFHPKLDRATTMAMALVFLAEGGAWLLAKASRDKVSRIFSSLICLFLMWSSFNNYDFNTHLTYIFGTPRTVPSWYLWSLPTLLSLPALFWLWWGWRYRGRAPMEQHDKAVYSR